MDERKSAFFTILAIGSVIVVFTLADLIQGDRLFSETENRVLAAEPAFSWEALLREGYPQKYETYLTDQFVSRDKWIAIKTRMDLALQKKEVGGVYLGREGYLIEQHLPEDYPAALEEERLALLERLVQEWDASVMLVPTADNVLTDRLPAYAPYYDQQALLERVKERVGAEHYIDALSALREHADEEIYYRTDHHWTTLGAVYGYRAWAEHMGMKGILHPLENMELASGSFLGTLHSKVNLDMPGDGIYYFPSVLRWPIEVTYDLRKKKESCYEPSYLETKNKYGFFLDDNHAFVEIATGRRNGKTLFIIKDSYANCFVPLLIPYYERIYVLDPRYFRDRLFGFMREYEPAGGMDVLVLYNCIHFLENFSYLE